MFYFIKRSFVWIRRMRYSKGFGVQSPWAYKFVREVINDHTPYSIYKDLKRQVYGLDKRTRKLCRLYYRLAKFVKPQCYVDYLPTGSLYKAYFIAGQNANYHLLKENTAKEEVREVLDGCGDKALVRMSLHGDYREFIDLALQKLGSQSVIIVQHIKRDSETKAFWDEVMTDPRVGVSFDLYYCGVLFLNTKMYKQNYIVNF